MDANHPSSPALEALHRPALAGAVPSDALDALTRLASVVLGVPAALVILIEDDQLVVASRSGVPEAAARETLLSNSLCRHVALAGEPLVITDIREHSVLRSYAPSSGVDIVACVGMPLTTRDGQLLGALCAFDVKPRYWSERDLSVLAAVASAVTTELALRDEVRHREQAERERGDLQRIIDIEREEQGRAAAIIRASEERHRQVLDSLPVIVYRAQAEFPYATVFINGAVTMLGYSREEWLARPGTWEASLHPDDRERVLLHAAEAMRRGEVMNTEYRYIARDGSQRWLQDRGEFIVDESGARIWQGVVRDITEQRAAEDAHRRSEERFHLAGRATQEVIWDWDVTSNSLLWSDAVFATFGHTPASISGDIQWWYDHVHPEDLSRVKASILTVLAGSGLRWTSEYRYRRGDGSYAHVLDRGIVARGDDGRPARMVGSMIDMTARIEAAEANRFQARLLDIVEQAVIATDLEGRVTYWNAHAGRLYGWTAEEAVGRPILNLTVTPEGATQAAELLHRITRGESWSGEMQVRRKDGCTFTALVTDAAIFDADGRPAGMVRVSVDATDRRQLEEQLRQSQKMEAVGRLAGGVAHDFNNLLTVIKASTELLLEDTDVSDPRREDVRHIADASERAAGLTRQLLAFSRKQILRPSVIYLNTAVTNLLPMLARLLGEDLRIETRLFPALGSILADVGQVEQVLVNLAVNARDAMPSGGRLVIETAEVVLDAPYAADYAQQEHEDIIPGQYVVLGVSDSGTGMSPEVRARAFEPFFTTKDAGRGTGLGLATVYGIVKQSGGHIRVFSEPGQGAVFTLYFPRLDASAVPPIAHTDEEPPVRGTETILLVEDQRDLRSLASRILERQGYTVLQSENGAEALSLAAGYAGEIHLVLTDVVMPHMSGRAMVEQLRAVRPSATVVYMSGYTDDDVLRRGIMEPGSRFMPKPFAPAELLRLIRDVLDQHG